MGIYGAYLGLYETDPAGTTIRIMPSQDKDKIVGWLNQLCPFGKFKHRGENGASVVYASELGFCSPETGRTTDGCSLTIGPLFADNCRPISCRCVCDAINSQCVHTIWDGLSKPTDLPWQRRSRRDRRTGGDGGYAEINKACDTDIFVGTLDGGLTGVGDTNPPRNGYVRTPEWIILAHELCGHAVPNMSHPFDDLNGDGRKQRDEPFLPSAYTPDDPVIVIENIIRGECSTKEDSYGTRVPPPRRRSDSEPIK